MNDNILSNIDNSFESYQRIIDFYNENKDSFFETINLSLEKWFAANFSAALGAILDKLQKNLNEISFNFIQSDIKTIIQKNGFLSHFGYPKIPDINFTTIKYLKLKATDGRFFNAYVVNELLNRPELPEMTLQLKKKITESIYEIFVNAQIHSETDFIYTCGQFYPKKNKIEFTIVDTGIGFKNRVNKRFNTNLSSIKAIKWATIEGHSTKLGISGGIGLAILKEFILKNKGKIQIISDDGFYQFNADGEEYKIFTGAFPGTIINMQFRTDDNSSYSLASEESLEDIF